MPITARDEGFLHHLEDIVHDLFYDVPVEELTRHTGTLSLDVIDADHVISKAYTYSFRLTIHNVVTVRSEGKLDETPGGEVEINRLRYDRKTNELSIIGVHPYSLIVCVSDLQVELTQLSPSGGMGGMGTA